MTIHISDHIHEWKRHHTICKIKLDDSFLLDWFLKTLLPPITKDSTSTMSAIEVKAITKAQQYDLIYSQSSYLYIILPNAP